MEEKIRLAVFGQKRLSREGGIEIVVKELCTRMAQNLVNEGKSCMAGFVLKNTLSDNGGVTRGVCKMDEVIGCLVNKNGIHNVLSFRGWHSEWNGIL